MKHSLLFSWLAGGLALAASSVRADVTIVDIVPPSMNSETAQNAEPNIAVNPSNPNKIVITAFGNTTNKNPIFLSTTGGSNWKRLQFIHTFDSSVDWSASGQAYLGHLAGGSGTVMVSAKLASTQPGYVFSPLPGNYAPGGDGPDQPWTQAIRVGTQDHVYIAFNDLSRASKTASVRYSLNGGQSWQTQVLERTVPGLGQDGSCVRVALKEKTVNAVFERYNSNSGNTDVAGDVIFTRDDKAGNDHFNDLAASTIASSVVFSEGNLGDERLGSDLSIAVDPNDGTHLYVAFAIQSSGTPHVAVYESTNSGVSWSSAYTTGADTALPALAVTTNGIVGLLFTKYTGGNLETHFIQTSNDFSSTTETTLSRFTNGSPASVFDPYIGDYEDLVAVGTTFFGTFSASNDTSLFPTQPTFLRDSSLLGSSVDYSIDPFFFKVTTVSNSASGNGGVSGGTLTLGNGGNGTPVTILNAGALSTPTPAPAP